MRIGTWYYSIKRDGSDWVVKQSVGRENVVEFTITYPTLLGALMAFIHFPRLVRLSKLDPNVVKWRLTEVAEEYNLTVREVKQDEPLHEDADIRTQQRRADDGDDVH